VWSLAPSSFRAVQKRPKLRRGFPTNSCARILSKYQRHLKGRTDLIKVVHSSGCCARGSCLGYLAACAAVLHKIATCSANEEPTTRPQRSLKICLSFLEQMPVCWPNHQTMVSITCVKPVHARCPTSTSSPLLTSSVGISRKSVGDRSCGRTPSLRLESPRDLCY
jgi:hypothetical protein